MVLCGLVGYIITVAIFIALQIGSGLIIITKLQGGQSALKEHLDSLATSVEKLSAAIAMINISDARFEERWTSISATIGALQMRIGSLEIQMQAARSKVHQLSGFVMRTFPEWREIERDINE